MDISIHIVQKRLHHCSTLEDIFTVILSQLNTSSKVYHTVTVLFERALDLFPVRHWLSRRFCMKNWWFWTKSIWHHRGAKLKPLPRELINHSQQYTTHPVLRLHLSLSLYLFLPPCVLYTYIYALFSTSLPVKLIIVCEILCMLIIKL